MPFPVFGMLISLVGCTMTLVIGHGWPRDTLIVLWDCSVSLMEFLYVSLFFTMRLQTPKGVLNLERKRNVASESHWLGFESGPH